MPDTTLNILLVEDNAGDARLLREALQEIDALAFTLTHVGSLAVGLDSLSGCSYDVGVLDLGLPDARGPEVVRRVREVAPDMPLIVLTGLDDEQLAVQSLHEGAQDYLIKGQVGSRSLWRSLRYALERHQLQLGLKNLSLMDDLTGLSNRRGFVSLAAQHARLSRRTGRTFLVGFIDLDGLKQINDTFGHQEGNHALVDTAGALRNSFRQCDILARYGGDEFTVLIADAAEGQAATVVDRVQHHVKVCNRRPGRLYDLSLSIGIVSSESQPSASIESLLHRADELMYEQKQDRRHGPLLMMSRSR
jgi:two-component system cell cycle response regulator